MKVIYRDKHKTTLTFNFIQRPCWPHIFLAIFSYKTIVIYCMNEKKRKILYKYRYINIFLKSCNKTKKKKRKNKPC